MDASRQSACARCGAEAASGKLLPSSIFSINAFVAIGITTDGDAEPMDHGDLIDKAQYCRSCHRIVAAQRILGIVLLSGICLVAAYIGMQLVL